MYFLCVEGMILFPRELGKINFNNLSVTVVRNVKKWGQLGMSNKI